MLSWHLSMVKVGLKGIVREAGEVANNKQVKVVGSGEAMVDTGKATAGRKEVEKAMGKGEAPGTTQGGERATSAAKNIS